MCTQMGRVFHFHSEGSRLPVCVLLPKQSASALAAFPYQNREPTSIFSYLHPVKNLLVTGHILQQEPLQLLAQLLQGQNPFSLSSIRARAVRKNQLELLVN